MLKKLTIQNFALIKNLEFIPDEGLNILTGETGAGKTIIVNALSLILGKRSDATFIRHGEQKLFIEAEFSLTKPSIISFLKQNDYIDNTESNDDNLLFIRREVLITGKSRAFINDSPVKINLLQELGTLLIDFHGQHDHQSLFNKELHLHILDRFLALNLLPYQEQFKNFVTLKNRLSSFLKRKKEKNDRIELISFQKKEIEKVRIESDDEDILLDEELKKLDSIEDIKKSAKNIENIINANSILPSLSILKEESLKLSEVDKNFKKIAQDLESSYLSIEDFNSSADYLASSIEFNEEQYNYLNNRFEEFQKLKKKYGPKLEDVLKYYEEISIELEDGESFDEIISKMRKELDSLKSKLYSLAKNISKTRKKGSLEFKKEIEKQFLEVGLKNSEFDVRFTEKNDDKESELEFQETGIDEIEFYIKTNVGDKFNPLVKTASGGEISRIMLAIKTITNSKEGVDTLVFDEIDTGISGEISEKVGNKILNLSKMGKQIFTITHIPFIASRGESHFVVRKKIINNSTETSMLKITKEERIKEISQMISSSITGSENLRASAEEMILRQ